MLRLKGLLSMLPSHKFSRPWLVRLLLALIVSVFAGGIAMADGIIGDTIVIQYLYPNSTTPFCCNTSGSGSATGVVTAAGVALTVNNSAQITVFNNNVQMLEILQPGGSMFQPALFNGVSIQDLTNPSAFMGVSVDPATTVPGFSISDVSVSGGLLFINFQGLTVPLNSLIQVDFTTEPTTSVPEPSTLALLAAGLLALGAFTQKKYRLVPHEGVPQA